MTCLNSRRQDAFTIPEVLVAAVICAVFFTAIFEVNGLALQYVKATKENVGAIQGVQDRLERLRNLAFTDLTSQNYMTVTTGTDPTSGNPLPGLLVSCANSSVFENVVTEVVTLTDFSSGSPGALSVTYNRAPGATSTPSVSWSGGSSFPTTTTMVRATVTHNWTMTFSGRSRTETSETIIGTGTKK